MLAAERGHRQSQRVLGRVILLKLKLAKRRRARGEENGKNESPDEIEVREVATRKHTLAKRQEALLWMKKGRENRCHLSQLVKAAAFMSSSSSSSPFERKQEEDEDSSEEGISFQQGDETEQAVWDEVLAAIHSKAESEEKQSSDWLVLKASSLPLSSSSASVVSSDSAVGTTDTWKPFHRLGENTLLAVMFCTLKCFFLPQLARGGVGIL